MARSMSLAESYAKADALEGTERAAALSNLASVEETLRLTRERDAAQSRAWEALRDDVVEPWHLSGDGTP